MPIIPQALSQTLRDSQRVAVLTGAGISAESGVPTFRDAQTGLWAQYDPLQLATPEAFQDNPKLVWDWYAWRRQLVRDVKPNPAHHALVTLEKHISSFTLITQNVDGLHRRAGSRTVLELHGNLFGTKCFKEGCAVDLTDEDSKTPPRCAQCGSWLRPDVVWFGESLPANELHQAEAATMNCEVFFSIGTSTQVFPAAELPFLALSNGAIVVEINPKPTPLSKKASYVLQGAAGEILPTLLQQTFPGQE